MVQNFAGKRKRWNWIKYEGQMKIAFWHSPSPPAHMYRGDSAKTTAAHSGSRAPAAHPCVVEETQVSSLLATVLRLSVRHWGNAFVASFLSLWPVYGQTGQFIGFYARFVFWLISDRFFCFDSRQANPMLFGEIKQKMKKLFWALILHAISTCGKASANETQKPQMLSVCMKCYKCIASCITDNLGATIESKKPSMQARKDVDAYDTSFDSRRRASRVCSSVFTTHPHYPKNCPHLSNIMQTQMNVYALSDQNRSIDASLTFWKIPELARGFILQSCTPAALSYNTSGCYRARCNKSCKHDNHRHLNWHNLLCQAMLRKKRLC